ncbi:hypothetical protein ACVR0S_00590 [Streptococcus dentapri]|uniref:Lipoprotein n=1 Tax=Streptococcus dentapri TaxID=573564 RepID=A0ABV8CZ77_9STRE
MKKAEVSSTKDLQIKGMSLISLGGACLMMGLTLAKNVSIFCLLFF